MLAKLKRGRRHARDVLISLFHPRGRKNETTTLKPYLKHADWDGLKLCMVVLVENVEKSGPLAASIMARLSNCIETYENQAEAHEGYAELGIDMNDLLRAFSEYLNKAASSTVHHDVLVLSKLAKDIDKEIALLRRVGLRVNVRHLTGTMTQANQVLEHYRHIRALLGRFLLNENTDMWKLLDEAVVIAFLDQLPYSPVVQYNSEESRRMRRHGCTPNTRVAVLQRLRDWAYYDDNRKICWLSGMAGTGKTTIAYSLCKELDSTGKLAGSFFCSRRLPACQDASCILPSISHQLSLLSRPFQYEVFKALGQRPGVLNLGFFEQLETLIAGPLRRVKHTFPGDLVVIIDALDECEDTGSVNLMLDALLAHEFNLPVRFFLTSRWSPYITGHERGELPEWELRLHDTNDSTSQQDIKKHLLAELGHLNQSDTNIDNLVQQSGGLFLYADILADNIRNGNLSVGSERLKQFLDTCGSLEIDTWYNTILKSLLDDGALWNTRKSEMVLALRTVIYADKQSTLDDLADLLRISSADLVQHVLRPLWFMLQVSDEGVVTPLHESTSSYILDRRYSDDLSRDTQHYTTQLALSCFDLIKQKHPSYNVCDLESSYLPDEEVSDIKRRVHYSISSDLIHVCRRWGEYLAVAEYSNDLFQALQKFLSTRLLMWMEILNLKRCVLDGVEQLRRVYIWLGGIQGPNAIRLLVHDALNFVTEFSKSPLLGRTPHIYLSMLPFWPEYRPVSTNYMPRMQGLVKVEGSAMKLQQRPIQADIEATREVYFVAYSPSGLYIAACTGQLIQILNACTGKPVGRPIKGNTYGANSVAYSPDGAHIVSRYEKNAVRIWDVRTGEPVGQPFEGHRGFIYSVAYSPDGAYIASGSGDNTIRIWDARTGELIGEPLKGHTSWVRAVSFSPVGMNLASGSDDNTIRIWNISAGQPSSTNQTLEGHTDHILAISYSPDGARIISGSADMSIRIWDVQTGQLLGSPLAGHTGIVKSVICSPNGAYIVSGSGDKSVRVWNAQTGEQIGPPLEGHSDRVESVAYSPDGAHIVSGCINGTILIWDAPTRQPLGDQRLDGHIDSITSVTYSPDGAQIASGSKDNTILIWDSQTRQLACRPLEGHTSKISSIAYSPNSAYVVSGSLDRTIRVWDAYTGQPVGQPLEGHTDAVNSVEYSPNGKHIVSGSSDCTVRIWDAHTGHLVFQPLAGHASMVNSVAYSPGGVHIASGSADNTIRIWEASNGHLVGQPLVGHTSSIASVAYSPDGGYISSGSHDKAIRIWDAHTGQPIGQPLISHRDWIRSIVYSPDGAYIISSSDDKTIRIWDAHSGESIGQPYRGHEGSVNSVAYSPDGLCLISGSDDKTIRIWDTRFQEPVASPHSDDLGGSHTSRVAPAWSTDQLSTLVTNVFEPSVQFSKNNWSLDKDGWIINSNQDRLIWVPPYARTSILHPHNTAIISRLGSISLDLHNTGLGKDWRLCFNRIDPGIENLFGMVGLGFDIYGGLVVREQIARR
ncbi:hypothetical protein FRC12_021476 [Ceratobasidium sp. 428]|nr:hypothetical protein FRC12_021476 [Ceratobasidium sp. 428]